VQALYEDNRDAGLMVVTVLTDFQSHEVPDADDCTEWADAYGATHPILADTSGFADDVMEDGTAFPFSLLIDRGMVIYDVDTGTRSITEEEMQELL
jgi:hypothetical protein